MHASATAGAFAPIRVALIEDDAELRDRILAPGLQDYGFDVIGLPGAAALEATLRQRDLDIVVLDVGLPGQDGFTIAHRLRSRSLIGIVMLTGLDNLPDRVRGLSEGADAYLAKPVEMELLAATLHSLARRLRAPAERPGDTATWRLGENGWCLHAPGGGDIALTMAERNILTPLLAARGEAVTRERLIASLTADVYDFDPHRLETLVHRLRRKVTDRTGERLPLRAVHGVGYVLAI